MRVLVTGHRGYIGSVMAGVLRNARCDVVGLDCDLYGDCDFGRVRDDIPSFDCDLRDVEFADLLSFDAVIHLAGLSENCTESVSPTLVQEMNVEATLRLADCCKQAQVPRMIFASSCAVYGNSGDELADEESTIRPLTPYAVSKMQCERALIKMADRSFAPVIMRNATVYGVSPRLRLDLVVNDFTAGAVCNGCVSMQTAGRAHRPIIHVEDLARIYLAVLTAPNETVYAEIFNAAISEQNYRVIDIADAVVEQVPHCTRRTTPDVIDRRSYRVDGSKLRQTFPRLSFRWTLPLGIRQIRTAMMNAGLTPGEWRSDRYRRAMRIQSMIENRAIDARLRRAEPVMA